jgi:hypothetical protein
MQSMLRRLSHTILMPQIPLYANEISHPLELYKKVTKLKSN